MVYLKIPIGNNAHEDIQHNIIYKHGSVSVDSIHIRCCTIRKTDLLLYGGGGGGINKRFAHTCMHRLVCKLIIR